MIRSLCLFFKFCKPSSNRLIFSASSAICLAMTFSSSSFFFAWQRRWRISSFDHRRTFVIDLPTLSTYLFPVSIVRILRMIDQQQLLNVVLWSFAILISSQMFEHEVRIFYSLFSLLLNRLSIVRDHFDNRLISIVQLSFRLHYPNCNDVEYFLRLNNWRKSITCTRRSNDLISCACFSLNSSRMRWNSKEMNTTCSSQVRIEPVNRFISLIS